LNGLGSWSTKQREERRLRVFRIKVLRRIFGRKREEMAGSKRRLNIEELYNLYTQKYIMREIKSKGSENWRDIYHACEIWDIHKNFLRSENLRTRDHLEDRGLSGAKKYSARRVNMARRCRLDVSGSGYVPDADFWETVNETSCSTECGELTD